MSFFQTLKGLPLGKQALAAFVTLAVCAAFYALVGLTFKPKMELLYGGLEPAVAGEVISKLSGMDVAYEVRGNAVYADVRRRDALRLELARDGLPRQNVVGYELFDDMNSFAMTSEMFNSTYWRAKQGELTRTLLTLPYIRSARVHLGMEGVKSGQDAKAAKTASVTVSTTSRLTMEQAKGIQYLTALAVAGLDPERVSIIDSVHGILTGPGTSDRLGQGGNGETAREIKIKENLLTLLEARVGPGNARVNITMDIDTVRETKTEHNFDPESRVIKSQTLNEVTENSSGTNGTVTVASNLPEAEGGAGTEESDRSTTTETTTYEISSVLRNTEKVPGDIKRITLAVLINDIRSLGADGIVTFTPRSEQELQDLRDLVASAAGISEARADNLTIRSMTFNQPIIPDLEDPPTAMSQFVERHLWNLISAMLLTVVILVLGLFVLRPLLRNSPRDDMPSGLEPLALGSPNNTMGGLPDLGGAPALEGPAGMADLSTMDFGGNTMTMDDYEEDPVDNLRLSVSDSVTDAADILSDWLDEAKPEKAKRAFG